MDVHLAYQGIHLSSIRQINALPETVKRDIYRALIPDQLLAEHQLAPLAVEVRCLENTGVVEIDIRHPAALRDPVLYFQIADTANGQIEVLLMIINDPFAPRFDVDLHWQGECTKLEHMPRNIPAEIAAMQAGLAPGQVRQGLRLGRRLIPGMEQFITRLGKDRFFIEPLTYHTAILFERYGFAYMVGQHKMEDIHTGFQPGGALCRQLEGSTPFRQAGFDRTIRGRSWAIHDGILGERWSGIRMYKRVNHHAGVCTFPGASY